MSQNPYAPDKALAHLDRLMALRESEMPEPVQVHFVISDLCNQHCSFCSYRTPGYTELFAEDTGGGKLRWNPNRMIEKDTAKRILAEMATVGMRAIQFTGGGEPTVHPDCGEIMLEANSLDMDTALVTNGVELDRVLVAEAVQRATWIRVSLDHATATGYAQMRQAKPETFDRVLYNIERAVEARGERLSPTIGVGFVVNRDNWTYVVDAARVARKLGADNFRISAVFQPANGDYFEGWREEARTACREAELQAAPGFQVSNAFAMRVEHLKPDYRRCDYQFLVTYLGADLSLYQCCANAYTKAGLIGSLRDASFGDVWHSKRHREMLARFDARTCARCPFNDKNRAIRAMLSPRTMHENFI